MHTIGNLRVRHLSACVMIAMGFAVPALAAPPVQIQPPPSIDFPAGTACDFAVRLQQDGSNFHLKDFFDKNGNHVGTIIAGRGSFVTYTNLETGATLSLKTYGFSAHQKDNGDGTITETDTGHFGVILGPIDTPAGPSTTNYVGQLVYTIDLSTGAYTLESSTVTGKATDICAILD